MKGAVQWGETASREPRGLTLIEVLIAVAILGVAFTVLLTAASRCLAVMKIARNYQVAQYTLGLGQLEHFVWPTNEIEEWEVDGEAYDNGFTFSRTVDEEEDEEEDDYLYTVRTRVTWSDTGRDTFEEVVQYVYLPTEEELDGALASPGTSAPADTQAQPDGVPPAAVNLPGAGDEAGATGEQEP